MKGIKDVITTEIARKKDFVTDYFRKKYQKEYIDMEEPLREFCIEIKEQIQICEELCCPVDEDTIRDWIDSENTEYVLRKARKIKLAS